MEGVEDLGHHAHQISTSFEHASKVLPDYELTPKRAWISERTLGLITQRKVKHNEGDYAEVKDLHKLVRASAKQYRQKFMDGELSAGGWKAIRWLRTAPPNKYASIHVYS